MFVLGYFREFEACNGESVPELDILSFKRLLVQALEELHGQVLKSKETYTIQYMKERNVNQHKKK
jgi:hypothetical protein